MGTSRQGSGNSLCKGAEVGRSLECLRTSQETNEQGRRQGVGSERQGLVGQNETYLKLQEVGARGGLCAEEGRDGLMYLYRIPLVAVWRIH